MVTPPAENTRIGEWIASRLNLCSSPVHLLIPEGGIDLIIISNSGRYRMAGRSSASGPLA